LGSAVVKPRQILKSFNLMGDNHTGKVPIVLEPELRPVCTGDDRAGKNDEQDQKYYSAPAAGAGGTLTEAKTPLHCVKNPG
jgi:hypothetical protein